MSKLEMIEMLVYAVKDGIANSDWRLHKSCDDAKCIIDMAEAMLEQEDYNGGVFNNSDLDENYEGDNQ